MVRLKHRYLVVHILYPERVPGGRLSVPSKLQFHRPTATGVDAAQILRQVRGSIEYMYGDYGLGLVSSSLKINYFSPATSTIIIRVARAHYRILWAGLTWMGSLENKDDRRSKHVQTQSCVFRVVHVSGTIRKAEEVVIKRAKEEIREAQLAQQSGVHGVLTKST